ncbi:MAG: FtsX-like permease family protein [Leptospiraceae bacterium]|nr:FtsX-like permease family protein [Leptospiraceae bacterium]
MIYTASIIAFISLFSAILYGLDDKLRIFSMMRTMGGGIIQISGIILSETFFLCFLGTFSGILSSLFLSPIIIDVINKNAFGWSLEIVQPIDLMVYFLLFTFPISVLVSIYPIWILKNLSLREILSYE